VYVLLLAASVSGVTCRGRAPGVTSRKLNAQQVADRAKPATVMIYTSYTATIQVPEYDINQQAWQSAVQPRLTRGMSEEDALRLMFTVLFESPDQFFVQGSTIRTSEGEIGAQGSGLIVTPDGYIATNAHNILTDEEDLKPVLINSIGKWIESDVEQMEQTVARMLRATLSDQTKQRLGESLSRYYARHAKLSNLKRDVFAITGYRDESSGPTLVSNKCEVVKVGRANGGKDVAILKMDGSNLPTLRLASSLNSSGVRTGSDIHILGFPGGVGQFAAFTLRSKIEPSLTSGRMSALRDMGDAGSDKFQVVETDATVNHGNSGGPSMDETGAVIGLATFGIKDQPGINYIVSVDVVQEFLKDANVKPATSEYTRKYTQALELYERNERPEALRVFRELQKTHPGVKAVDEFVQRLGAGSQNVSTSTTAPRTPSPTVPVSRSEPRRSGGRGLLIFGLFAGVAIVVLIVVVVANKN
jgi:S1-C subfamily serine protease